MAGNSLGGSASEAFGNSGSLNNTGTFVKSGAGTTTRILWPVANSGIVDVQSGRLALAALSQPGGSYQVANGATLSLQRPADSPFTGTYTLATGGSIDLLGGHLQGPASFPSGPGTVNLLANARVSLDTIPAERVRFAGPTQVTPPSKTLTVSQADILPGATVLLLAGDAVRVTGDSN